MAMVAQRGVLKTNRERVITFTCAHCRAEDIGTFVAGCSRIYQKTLTKSGEARFILVYLCRPNVRDRMNCYDRVVNQNHPTPCYCRRQS